MFHWKLKIKVKVSAPSQVKDKLEFEKSTGKGPVGGLAPHGLRSVTKPQHRVATKPRPEEIKMAVADVVIKQEAVDAVDLEERVVELCKANPKGITDQLISQDMPNIPPQQRVTAINRLLSMVGLRRKKEIHKSQ